MNRYRMYVELEEGRKWVRTTEADHRIDALRDAIYDLDPACYDKPIKLEEEDVPGEGEVDGGVGA